MTREEAIKILTEIRDEASESESAVCYVASEEDVEAIDIAIEALQVGWIPVSERLPDEGVNVNVTLKDFSETRAGFYSEEGWWLITEHDTLENYPIQYVVAWQPLPKPYKEQKDD